MSLTENELIELALQESKDFAKEIWKYFFEISRERQLTEKEKALYESAHEIHIRTNDALLLLNEMRAHSPSIM